jgi:hypothetical protein
MDKFLEFYKKGPNLPIIKYKEYLDVYANHFNRFIGRHPLILEIGIHKGGSLEMWNFFFDGNCKIYGIDNSERCKQIPYLKKLKNVEVHIGDQEDPKFWESFKDKVPKFDIIIDDGGHTSKQQIVTFECMYDHMKDDGVYLCEDVHTSYWKEFGGGLEKEISFVNYTKTYIDKLNAGHWRKDDVRHGKKNGDLAFTRKTNSIHYYDSIVVFERKVSDGTLHLIKI